MSWQWKMMQNFKRNWLVISKLTQGTSQILTQALKSLKDLCFNWLLVTKVYIAWATQLQKSYLLWHWRNFSPEHLKVSKLGFWWDCFVQSRKVMTLNLQTSYVLWQWRYDTKFEEELICHFKTDVRNLTNFDSSTPKSKKKMLFN